MSAWADVLTRRFARANEEMIAVAARCSDAQWRARCAAEGWSVGVVLHHVADDYLPMIEVIQAIATDRPVPAVTRELLDERNARHARPFAGCSREETVALLRRNGTAVANAVTGFSDEQLGRTGRVLGRDRTAAQLIDPVLLSHSQRHLARGRAAL